MSNEANGKGHPETGSNKRDGRAINRRNILLGTSTLVAAATLTTDALAQAQKAAPAAPKRWDASRNHAPRLSFFARWAGGRALSIRPSGSVFVNSLYNAFGVDLPSSAAHRGTWPHASGA